MDLTKLKNYARQARRDFIRAVTERAAFYGLTAKSIEPVTEKGDVAIIAGQAFPQAVASKRNALEQRIAEHGFEQTMEAMAYTWFNRFVAIRFMELHGYLEHGYRVLSHSDPARAVPEILDHAEQVDLPRLDRATVIELKLAASKDAELYRLLLVAQCNALHDAMPFLFERVDDESELLLPDNLLHSDSLIRQLVEGIDESAWAEIEIIGWLYQFYISEKKEQVIGKVVKAEDIPAATQLFTPNWIVKYLVQNSLGAQWLATYPNSTLKGQMAYYIEPAEQTDEVKAQLKAITPSTLNPEEMTLIDPACGSGHILVEAYDLFKAIYLERGYRQRDVTQLILEKNLFGLDIDERAAQLTGFALMMKGRSDDRRLFERGVKPNVMALVDRTDFDAERLAKGVKLSDYGLQLSDLTELKRLFEHTTTFGSLIQVPDGLLAKLSALKKLSEVISQDLFVSDGLKRLGPLVQQARLLASQYDAVVANPPYMGSKFMNALVKKFAKDYFPDAKGDLFACFIERGYTLAKDAGHNAMVTMQSWMFLSTFEKMRERMLQEKTIETMAHLGARAFGSISGEVVQTTAFVLKNRSTQDYKPVFFRLLDGGEEAKRTALANGEQRFDATIQREFKKIPGSPVAYWVSEALRRAFGDNNQVSQHFAVKKGMDTGDNDELLRRWFEVDFRSTSVSPATTVDGSIRKPRWFPYNKGGSYRKWYGNHEYLIDWDHNGRAVRAHPGSTLRNEEYYFRSSVSWSDISSSSSLGVRRYPAGFIHDNSGPSVFGDEASLPLLLAYMASPATSRFLSVLNPTLHYQVGNVSDLPWLLPPRDSSIFDSACYCISQGKGDWNAYERSWEFQSLPILTASSEPIRTLESSYTAWITRNREAINEMKRREEANNRLFIDAYGLQDELTPEVPIEQITLTVNPTYRYGGKLTEEEQWARFRQDTVQEVVSYAIGCMMGRYSLDAPGLIYAHSGNAGFDPGRYKAFPADDDGIIPVTDVEWFNDDAAHRVVKFISVACDAAHLEENLSFLADNLSPKKDESSRDTIRRYLCDNFFKDHLQTYKKRPIYWLFSSGKQRAFQCLVYLHRYNEGTLSRMRTEYVIPLQGKIASRIDQLVSDIQKATSTSHRKKLEKERDTLLKQQKELLAFDENLRHYADQRISLDLDEGVKVNYGKFGDLLAEAQAVTGSTEE